MSGAPGPRRWRYTDLMENSLFWGDVTNPPNPAVPEHPHVALAREQRWRCLCQVIHGYPRRLIYSDVQWALAWPTILNSFIYYRMRGVDIQMVLVPEDTPTDVLAEIFDPIFRGIIDLFGRLEEDSNNDDYEFKSASTQEVADVLFAGHHYLPPSRDGLGLDSYLVTPQPRQESTVWDPGSDFRTRVEKLYLDFSLPSHDSHPGASSFTTITQAIIMNATDAGRHQASASAAQVLRETYLATLALPHRPRYSFINHTFTAACITWNHLPLRFQDYEFIEPAAVSTYPPHVHPNLSSQQGMWLGSEDFIDYPSLNVTLEVETFILSCSIWRLRLEITLDIMRSSVMKSFRFIPPLRLDIDMVIWTLHEASQILAERSNGEMLDPEPEAILPVQEGVGPGSVTTYWKRVALGSIEHPAPMILKFLLFSLSQYRAIVVETLGASLFSSMLTGQLLGRTDVQQIHNLKDPGGTIRLDNFLPLVPLAYIGSEAFTGIFIHRFIQELVLKGDYTILHHPHRVTRPPPSTGRRTKASDPPRDPQIPWPVVANVDAILSYIAVRLSGGYTHQETFWQPPGGIFHAFDKHQQVSARKALKLYSSASSRPHIQSLEGQWMVDAGSGVDVTSRWKSVAMPSSDVDMTQHLTFRNLVANPDPSDGAAIWALIPFEDPRQAALGIADRDEKGVLSEEERRF
ncbi:hypothetical protein FPV67DRAFT_1677689 [Lyophyllum atratum]|nr:hypothetical protein FPV67DRAFT_1677689 [Lyophyllum atratum]